ncbi:MAG: hypothetical protein GKR89_15805 [Candidatus Latescibacteria bacterium]|nr:hypothetical protein [Candidatus Latescibacterota bacterium]
MMHNSRGAYWAALVALCIGVGAVAPAQAQIQPFLKARNPFMWDGVSGHTLLGAEVSTLSLSAASIIDGVYGELSWDIEGLLGSGRNLEARAPSFLFKFIPAHVVSDVGIGNLITVSVGTRALTGLDVFAGLGTYVEDGRFALGGGANMTWEKMEGGQLSSPSYEWILRGYAKMTPQLGIDVAATLDENIENMQADAALVYEVFRPSFHLYVAFIDVFSEHVDRRFGLSYAIGI